MIRESIAKVKGAVATKDVIPYHTYYCVTDGFIHATNDRIVAAAPFPDSRTYLVPAKTFEKSLEKMPGDDIDIQESDGALTLRCGRYRAKIKLLQENVPNYWRKSEGNVVSFPSGLIEKIKALRPFISDNATQPFALCMLMTHEKLVVTNNVVVAAAYDTELPEMYAMLPVWGIDFILERDHAPVRIIYDDRQMTFEWLDGSWMRSRLMDIKFPEVAKTLIEEAPQPEWLVTPEWKDIYNDVASLVQSDMGEVEKIKFYADKIVGTNPHGEFVADIETPTPEGGVSIWNPNFLGPVITSATHFDPTLWPGPCPFVGNTIAGVILGVRR